MRRSQRVLPIVLALALVAGALLAQGTTSALTGRVVHDGAGLPGVTVTITSPNMQGERVEITDVNGNYNFPAIPPGDYTVSFSMDGMAPVQKTTRVALAATQRVNAEMSLTAVAEAITVTAAAPAVLETTEVQTNFTNQEVDNLPVTRTVQGIVSLSPGVNTNGPNANPRSTNPPSIVISGAQAYDSLFLVNGAVTNENLRGQTESLFIEDAIEETTIMTGSISAEYGRFTGGVVSAITKSGGNDFSGSIRDSLSNPAWTDVTPRGEPKADSVLNHTYEATLGGRILRDRLWFFGAGRMFEQDIPNFFTDSDIQAPTTIQTDERLEVKLTGQIAQGHNLVGSYLTYEVDQTPHCAFGCWDVTTMDLDGRQIPREMMTANYNGVITSNFLLEAGYSTRDQVFEGSGGNHVTTDFTNPRDVALGMWGYDFTAGGAWGSPIFCGVCDAEVRENEYYNVKGTYYLATEATGSHSIVFGYENFAESRFANNYQSGSNFDLYIYSGISPTRTESGELRPVFSAGDLLLWWPIFEFSQGSDFVTHSLFINDKWDLSPKWSFNAGVRYDKNDGVDSAGNSISKDSNFSPRLGAIYDLRGDGRMRLNASYSRYVSRIQEGIGGNNGGGNPSTFSWEYDGPDIGGPDSGMDSFDVLEAAYRWFLGIGGTENTSHLVGASIPGLNTIMTGDLKSPNVDEITIGFGSQVGANGYFRADLIDRTWNDFYALFTPPNDQVPSPSGQGNLDNQIYGNTNDVERTYQAVQLQAAYRALPRLNFGGNYTWSQIEGNGEGENAGSGPITDSIHFYPEYRAFDANSPVGPLLSDQTHKARLWASYDQPLGALGNLNISLLERFDSGRPYSAFTAALPVADYVDNPGYATPPDSVEYFFSDRGEYRWEDTFSTDLALNWSTALFGVNVFAEGEVLNLLDESAQINGNTSVSVLEPFNPFTETPVEGVHWAKGSNFGKATSVNHYQLPRTYR
ncbi:MAG TPA: TonB-dependent receptor, partial [Thermoanaerobaculia bacterium]|nr:TonB-dependent receptor [Thermoanaerobaculia bacterium]